MLQSLQPVTLDALPILADFLPHGGSGDCNHSLAALISRAREHETAYAVFHDRLLIRWRPVPEAPLMWMAPIGCTSCGTLIEELEHISLEEGEPLRLWGTVPDLMTRLQRSLPYRNFTATTSNAWWDYLYRRDQFATLEGRRLNGKRNFARRFRAANPEARFEPLNDETVPLCLTFLNEWYADKGAMTPSMQAEADAAKLSLEHRQALGIQGGVLMSGDRVCGFTYGAMVSPDVFAVHVEKASREVTGAYPVLASELAKTLPESVLFLNREEDLGLPGLRKAKSDWAPASMNQKGWVTLEGQNN